MKKLYILIITIVYALNGIQAQTSHTDIDIPDAYTYSVDSLAFYIDSHCRNDEAKLHTLYSWLTSHMHYNVYPTFISVNEKRDEKKEMLQALKNREGVCRHFALIFQAVCNRMDIPSFFVEGYTQSNGIVMPEPHAWCAALVSGKWYQYDPTFGMGYVHNYQFISSPNHRYCQVAPDVFIRTHMPFDPLWQFLHHPYAYQTFEQGSPQSEWPADVPDFNYTDTLRMYLKQTPAQRLMAVNERIRHNGRSNRLIDYYLQLNTANIAVHRQNEVYNIYKNALKHYNRSVDNFNEVIRYRRVNKKIKKEGKTKIENWLQEAENAIEMAERTINTAQQVPEQYETAINNLKNAIAQANKKIKLLKQQ